MDPLTGISLVASMSSTFQLISNKYRHPSDYPKSLAKTMSEIEILNAIFLDSMTMLSSLTTTAPRSAEIAARQCTQLATTISEMIIRSVPAEDAVMLNPKTRALMERVSWDVASFRTAVTLLREIATDATTHDLIKSQLTSSHVRQKRRAGSVDSSGTDSAADPEADTQKPEDFNSYAVHDKFMTQGGDLYLQYGTICVPVVNSSTALWQPVKIKFDTGSDFNLVSREVLNEMNFVGPYEEPRPITAVSIGGQTFDMKTRVRLSWQLHKSPKTERTRFYVVETAPFDLLIGKKVTGDHDLEYHSRNFLLHLKMPRRSKDEIKRTAQRTKDKDDEAIAAEQQRPPLPSGSGALTPTGASTTTSSETSNPINADS